MLLLSLPIIGKGLDKEDSETDSKRVFYSLQYLTLSANYTPNLHIQNSPPDGSQKILASRTGKRELLWEKILECESGNSHYDSDGNVKCNGQFGCKGGIGICQLVPSTVKNCERVLGEEIDPFDKQDNLKCGRWLFENDGWRHWGGPTTWWGSYDCFKGYVKYY